MSESLAFHHMEAPQSTSTIKFPRRTPKRGKSKTSLWRHKNGKLSNPEKCASQQRLTPQEEDALVRCFLSKADEGYHLPTRYMRKIVFIIDSQRYAPGLTLQPNPSSTGGGFPGKNWPQGFVYRHPQLHTAWMTSVGKRNCIKHQYDSIEAWLQIIAPYIDKTKVQAQNVYQLIIVGVVLKFPEHLEDLVHGDALQLYLDGDENAKVITAMECASANGRVLNPLIVWPSGTIESTWTTHSTPGWSNLKTETGFLQKDIFCKWIKAVFEPQTKSQANGRPRVLECDALGNYGSGDLSIFAAKNNIQLRQLNSSCSSLLLPHSLSIFRLLKGAFSQEIHKISQIRSKTKGRLCFTELYDRARQSTYNTMFLDSTQDLLSNSNLNIVAEPGDTNSGHQSTPEMSFEVQRPQNDYFNNVLATLEDLVFLKRRIELDETYDNLSISARSCITKAFEIAKKTLEDLKAIEQS